MAMSLKRGALGDLPIRKKFSTIRKRRYVNGTARAQEACHMTVAPAGAAGGTARAQEACHSVGLAECYICYICYIMTYTLRVRVLAVAYMR